MEDKEGCNDSKNSLVTNRNRNQNGLLLVTIAVIGLVVIYLALQVRELSWQVRLMEEHLQTLMTHRD